MRALVSRQPGGPATLELVELPVPEPGAGEVRVRVAAVGVNYPDVLIIEDRYQFRPPRPFAPGAEIAGVVDAVGHGVEALAPGDRVAAMLGWGGMAEFVVAPARDCVALPAAMPFDVAAAMMLTYGTSLHALADRAALRAGETLLVLGAAGGVGLAAVELGVELGARVVAAVSSPAKLDLALARGAQAGVVYPPGPFDKDGSKALAQLLKDACGPGGCDVVYDPVGGALTEAAVRALAWGGRLLVVGFPAGIPTVPANLLLLKGAAMLGVFWGAFTKHAPAAHAANIARLVALWEAGRIAPTIHARVALAQGGEAIAMLARREAMGKVVVMLEG